MPTRYQFQPLALEDEKEFEELILDLYNELSQGKRTRFEQYGRKGQNQDGIDIINFREKIVIQCKKKELAGNTTPTKNIKNALKKEMRADLISAISSKNFEFEKFIFATTFPQDTDLQTLASELSDEFNKIVEYLGWGTISYKLHDCPTTINKYYNSLIFENPRLTDLKFKEVISKKHIIDQCYESLKRFEGFNFITPKTISKIFPFNINDTRDYSSYNLFCLTTNNLQITNLFQITELKNGIYRIKPENENQCKNANTKLRFIHKYLRENLITCIQTTQQTQHPFKAIPHKDCNCNACLSDEFKFTELIKESVNNKEISLSSSYGYYKLHDFSKAKTILNSYIRSETNPIKLSIARYNEYWLQILDSNENISRFEFSTKIRNIKVDSEPVQEAILNLEQDKVLCDAHFKVDNLLNQIQRIFNAYKKPGFETNGPNYANQLYIETLILFNYYRNNFLVKDIYSEYKTLNKKAFTGWLLSLNTSEKYNEKLKELDAFQVSVCINNFNGKELLSIIKETNTNTLKINEKAKIYLSKISLNFFSQFNEEDSVYGDYVNKSFSLASSHRSIFQVILINLAYSSISKPPKDFYYSLYNYIKKQQFLYLYDYKYIGILFRKKGFWFTPIQHIELLKYQLELDTTSSTDLISALLYSLKRNHTDYKIEESDFSTGILNLIKRYNFSHEAINDLRLISSETILEELDNILISNLKKEFNYYLYRQLLIDNVALLDNDNHLFISYVKELNKIKGQSVITNENGREYIYSYEFLNFISSILHSKTRTFHDQIIKENLTNLSQYQKWLIDPINYDYKNFKVDWIQMSDIDIVLKHLGKSSKLKNLILNDLKLNPDKNLSQLYIRMII